MPTGHSRGQGCGGCGRPFHPARWNARYGNERGGNERRPLVDEEGGEDDDDGDA